MKTDSVALSPAAQLDRENYIAYKRLQGAKRTGTEILIKAYTLSTDTQKGLLKGRWVVILRGDPEADFLTQTFKQHIREGLASQSDLYLRRFDKQFQDMFAKDWKELQEAEKKESERLARKRSAAPDTEASKDVPLTKKSSQTASKIMSAARTPASSTKTSQTTDSTGTVVTSSSVSASVISGGSIGGTELANRWILSALGSPASTSVQSADLNNVDPYLATASQCVASEQSESVPDPESPKHDTVHGAVLDQVENKRNVGQMFSTVGQVFKGLFSGS